MNRKLFFLVLLFASLIRSAEFDAFNALGAGGRLHDHRFMLSYSAEVFELDAFLRIDAWDLNGSSLGTAARLSSDLLPPDLEYSFSAALSNEQTDVVLTYVFTYSGTTTLSNLLFVSYGDIELNQDQDTFFNEYASIQGGLTSPSIEPEPDHWEIDEPGFQDGDLPEHLQIGLLDDSAATQARGQEDVAMALGFLLGNLNSGDVATVTLMFSETGNALSTLRLLHRDHLDAPTQEITYSGRSHLEIANEPPQALCRDVQLPLSADGTATLTALDVDQGSFDPEDQLASMTLSRTNFSCANLGSQLVVLTVSDMEGAFSACTSRVTVLDVTPPILTLNGETPIHLSCGAPYRGSGGQEWGSALSGGQSGGQPLHFVRYRLTSVTDFLCMRPCHGKNELNIQERITMCFAEGTIDKLFF